MNNQSNLFEFIAVHWEELLGQIGQHVNLVMLSIFFSIIIAIPIGIFIAKNNVFSRPILGLAGILQTIPSIALLGLLIPLLGIGKLPAVVALFLYGLLPIISNTFIGISSIDSEIKEAAKGLGMDNWQLLIKIELPLAMPMILTGIRIATVINVGVATLAAYIAAGGLGEFIFGGISLNNSTMMLAGAIPTAILALIFDFLFSLLKKLKLKKMSNLLSMILALIFASNFIFLNKIKANELLAGFTPEFIGRYDGYIGLKNIYQLKIPTVVINDAVMYKAIHDKKLDVISGYSTDGRIKAFNLLSLKDDKNIFPSYNVAPIVKEKTLQKFPELEPVLNLLAGKIDDSVMTSLNYKVDYLHKEPSQVALEFLKNEKLYKPAKNIGKKAVIIGSKVFDEQYILANIYELLIKGHTSLKVIKKTGLGGTKICFDALLNDQIDFYPEYSGTGLTVILNADINTIQKLSNNEDSLFRHVSREFDKKFKIKWLRPVGFNNTYAVMMRQEDSKHLKINSITDLSNYLNYGNGRIKR